MGCAAGHYPDSMRQIERVGPYSGSWVGGGGEEPNVSASCMSVEEAYAVQATTRQGRMKVGGVPDSVDPRGCNALIPLALRSMWYQLSFILSRCISVT